MSNIIGIDVGKMSLDCAWLRDLDQDKPKRKKVENSPQGFKSMLTWAQDVSGLAANELSFMVEPTGIYHEFLVQFLYQHQATIYLVNTSMVRKFAAGMGILSKNDLIDADMLTRYGLLNRKLQPYQPEAQEISDLKSLLNRLDSKRSVLGGSALIVLHFSVIELEDCFESLLTGGDKKTAVGVW